jgi:amino acid transporter/nucleotide-binding universal stress UspA family protein
MSMKWLKRVIASGLCTKEPGGVRMDQAGQKRNRHIGLYDATGIGVGAIVGGGILALAGTAFAATGPGAWLAFLLNGIIAIITALSFAELSTAFPMSGGTYLFAKRVLSVGAAFSVGWVVWFASIVASALYVIGFTTFLLNGCASLWDSTPAWLCSSSSIILLSLLFALFSTFLLGRSAKARGNWINVLKLLVFAVLIAGGIWVWWRDRPDAVERLTPVLPFGPGGLLQAMGYTFIALQGFDLIAAVAGEVREPRRVIPRAMLLSLAISLGAYIPMMVLICVVGLPEGATIADLASQAPDTVVAKAAEVFLGQTGFWLVIVVGLLAMLSASLANLFAASRIAEVMAQDRTLPSALERINSRYGTPQTALWCTGILTCIVIVVVIDVGRAGAAASLIFLVTFALANLTCIMARKRKPDHHGFRTPAWPILPALGLVACTALAIFQGVAVPAAGLITGSWFVGGFFCYLWLFGRRARIYDAASESVDPDLLELRGRSPLVLVPIANPSNAGAMALLAACITPPRVGRVLLLSVTSLRVSDENDDNGLVTTAEVLRQSIGAAIRERVRVEGLVTVSADPWTEIMRVARTHRCASVLLGMTNLNDAAVRGRLENLASRLPGNVVIFRAPRDWHPRSVHNVLVPIGGRVVHNALRARLLNGLRRRVDGELMVRYLLVLPMSTVEKERQHAERLWSRLVTDETSASSQVSAVLNDDVASAISEAAEAVDLVVFGLNKPDSTRRVFGSLTTCVIQNIKCAVMVIGQQS